MISNSERARETALELMDNTASHWHDIILSAPNKAVKQECISCHNEPDEINRASICRTCWVQWSQLKAERDKAIEVLAEVQKSLAAESRPPKE